MERSAASCLILATAFICVAIALLALRKWREPRLRRKDLEVPPGLPVIDYLVLVPIVVSVLFVLLPLLTLSNPGKGVITVAQGSCAVSATVIAAYPFAILDQQRRQRRTMEGALFVVACTLAALGAIAMFWYC